MSVQRNLLMSQQDKTIYNSLKKNLVVHYDIEKQGINNKKLLENPILKDFAGENKYDYTWKDLTLHDQTVEQINDTLFHYSGTPTNNNYQLFSVQHSIENIQDEKMLIERPSFLVRVYGLKTNQSIKLDAYGYPSDEAYKILSHIDVSENGIYEMPWLSTSINNNPDNPCYWSDLIVYCTTTSEYDLFIEILPHCKDMPLKNFLGDKSGIGYYPVLFSSLNANTSKGNTLLSIDTLPLSAIDVLDISLSKDTPEFSIKVDGNFDNTESDFEFNIRYYYINNSSKQQYLDITSNGTYTLPYSYNSLVTNLVNSLKVESFTGTIEILPHMDSDVDVSFRPMEKWYKSPNADGDYTVVNNTLHIVKTNSYSGTYYCNNNRNLDNNVFVESVIGTTIKTKPFTIRCNGLSKEIPLSIRYLGFLFSSTGEQLHETQEASRLFFTSNNGIVNVPSFTINLTKVTEEQLINQNYNFQFPIIFTNTDLQLNCDITIELLPNSGWILFDPDDFSYAQIYPFFNAINMAFSESNGMYTTGDNYISKGWIAMSSFYNRMIPNFRIRLKGINEQVGSERVWCMLVATQNNEIIDYVKISSNLLTDGIYEIPNIDTSSIELLKNTTYGVFCNLNPVTGKSVRVDLLPYGNAIPTLNKEKGFTVITKRQLFYDQTNLGACAVSNSLTGAFVTDLISSGTSEESVISFGTRTACAFPNSDISYMTSKISNGISINSGNEEPTNSLFISRSRQNNTQYSKIQLSKVIIFDRDLTMDEINWVKTHML